MRFLRRLFQGDPGMPGPPGPPGLTGKGCKECEERLDRLERVVLLSLKMQETLRDGFYPPSDVMETFKAMKERHPDVY